MSGRKTPRQVPVRLIKAQPHLPANGVPGALSMRRLPEITSTVSLAGLEFARAAVRDLLGNLKPTHRPGRDQRFRDLLVRDLRGAQVVGLVGEDLELQVRARVLQSFGKPTLVSFDLVILDPQNRLQHAREVYLARTAGRELEFAGLEEPELHLADDGSVVVAGGRVVTTEEQSALAVLATDLLDRAARAMWDNPELAPVAVRGRMLVGPTQAEDDEETLLLDLRDIGYPDEIARAEDLFERYGPPAFDRAWRP